jgi:acyl-coenzyme A thioesterase PaaI-like protein
MLMPGFAHPPIDAFLDSKLESHDPIAGVLRLSFSTIPQYANPAGMVMGGIVAAFMDGSMGPLAAAATGGTKFPISTDLHTQYFKGGPYCHADGCA